MSTKSAILPPPTLSGPSLLDIGAPAEAVKADFARRLQHALNSKGWNQSDLARAADIGRDSVSVYLRAKSLPGPKHLTSIAAALGVEPDDLLPGASDAATARTGVAAMEVMQTAAAGRVWLKINRSVSLRQLGEIIRVLDSEPAGDDS